MSSSSDFPASYDVQPAVSDGVDFVADDEINPIIQGAWKMQEALGNVPYAPQATGHGSWWNFPASVAGALEELARIEVREISISMPNSNGYEDIVFKNPGRFTGTTTNSVEMIVVVQRIDADGDALYLSDDYPNLPNNPVTQLNYDASNNVEGFRLNGLPTSGDYRDARFRYFAMEVDW